MGQAREVGQLDGGAVGLPHRLERPVHLLAHESVLDLLDRLVDVGHVVMPSALPVPGGLGGADPVDGPAPGHGHQPGAGTAPRLGVGAGRAPHLEEDLLENLLALGAVDDDLQDQRE